MCSPISIIMSADSAWTPQTDGWHHHHSAIAKAAGLPDGMMGDKYARVEVTPSNGRFRDPVTNAVVQVDETWEVRLDERRAPAWWAEDGIAQIDRAREIAAKWLRAFPEHLVPGARLTGGHDSTLTGGDRSTLTGGHDSTLTGGDRSTLTGGDRSTLTGGHDSTLTGGHDSTLTGGHDSTLTGGYGSTLTGGYGSTLTGGDRSTLTGGDRSTLTGGDRSTLTGGYGSTLTGGYRSTLTGGDRSTLTWRYWDEKAARYRVFVCYTGENGIDACVQYEFELVDGSPQVKKKATA